MSRKPFGGRLLAACALSLIVVGCSDPEVQKVKYFEQGNTLMAAGKLADAIIEYRNAIKLDAKYGEARFQLARALEQRGDRSASGEYVRAADLLPSHFDAQIKAATILLKARRFEQAQQHADKALVLHPRSAEAQVVKAYTLAGMQDMDGALEEMERATQAADGDYRPFTNLGGLHASQGKTAEAEAAFKQAVLTNPTAPEPKLALAYFYSTTQRLQDAEQVLQDVLKVDLLNVAANQFLAQLYISAGRPGDAEVPLRRLVDLKDKRAALMLGDLYAATNRRKEARSIYDSLLSDDARRDIVIGRLSALDYRETRKAEAHARVDARLAQPTPPVELLVLKTQFLSVEGKRAEALAMARKAVAVDAKSAQAHYWLGVAEEANMNHQAGIAAHTEALRLAPGLNDASIALSRLMAVVGQPDAALQHAQTARKAAPGNPTARLAVVRALLQKQDLRQAEAEVAMLSGQFPKSPTVQAMHGHVLLAKGDRTGAAMRFDQALELDATDADALVGRIQIDLHAKRPNDARARVQRALAKNPNDGAVLMAAARLEATDNKPDVAEKYLRKAIEADPANLPAYGLLARLYLKQNRLEDGKRELQHIAGKRKDAVAARTMIGMIEQLQGKEDDAINTYAGILKDNPRAPLAANNLAYLYASRNERIDEALTLAQAAKTELPDSHEISDTLGWVYIKKGLPEQAIRELRFSVSKSPQNPEYLYHLGLAYAKAGRSEEAEKALGEALRIKSDFQGANEARQTLASLK
jgi:tetratricopeptide (TPR) repeat protein